MTPQPINSDEPRITVFYEKTYMDDCGKNIPELFSKNAFDNICLRSYWGNTIDAFSKHPCLYMITAIHGDFRVVIPHEVDGGGYKFTQYFVSGLDGKIIKIPKNIWFGINNLNNTTGMLLLANVGINNVSESLDDQIFEWYSKR